MMENAGATWVGDSVLCDLVSAALGSGLCGIGVDFPSEGAAPKLDDDLWNCSGHGKFCGVPDTFPWSQNVSDMHEV